MKPKLGALFYPKEFNKKTIPFDSLFIPYIYKEIYFDGIYADIFNQKKDMVVIDVGANIGVVTQYMREFSKKVYAIEPSPEHFEALRKNKEFNNWDNVEVFNMALADKDGDMDFSVNDFNRTMNTLAIEPVGENGRYKFKGVNYDMGAKEPYHQGLKVKTMAFDSFFNLIGESSVDFVKFDVEGAEDMILRSDGFRKIFDKIKAIEVEFHLPNFMELVKYMADLGFEARRYECSAIVVLFTRR